MIDKVNIAIDAMGGENSPKKIIDGIKISLEKNKDNFFLIFGKKDLLEKELIKKKIIDKYYKIIDTNYFISDDESPESNTKTTNQ